MNHIVVIQGEVSVGLVTQCSEPGCWALLKKSMELSRLKLVCFLQRGKQQALEMACGANFSSKVFQVQRLWTSK